MAGNLYGADPEQLAQLGTTLRNQIEAINGVISVVTNALGGTTWSGPARQQFESEWTGSFRTALNNLNQAFDMAGQDCTNRSSALRDVMGAR